MPPRPPALVPPKPPRPPVLVPPKPLPDDPPLPSSLPARTLSSVAFAHATAIESEIIPRPSQGFIIASFVTNEAIGKGVGIRVRRFSEVRPDDEIVLPLHVEHAAFLRLVGTGGLVLNHAAIGFFDDREEFQLVAATTEHLEGDA